MNKELKDLIAIKLLGWSWRIMPESEMKNALTIFIVVELEKHIKTK